MTQAFHYRIKGQVQGVGFRPYIYRLATQYQLIGWVKNIAGQVEVHVQGTIENLDLFDHNLLKQIPQIANPKVLVRTAVDIGDFDSFDILASEESQDKQIHVPPDYFTCHDCLQELNDPHNHRYRYPFINCTQCGPRYTIIHTLPYDRPNTSMAAFEFCPQCQSEYTNPLDRRFHAQPLACPVCGPQLQFKQADKLIDNTELALSEIQQALAAGYVIAVKGIGGYHLICDATQDKAVKHLRQQKPRPDKPLAVMFPADYDLTQQVNLTPEELKKLSSPARPIILATKAGSYNLSSLIAPHLNELGVMLPYSPLHHLLLNDFQKPLVATSANISGEPVLTDNQEVETRLQHVAQAYLHHNRPIVRPADDSVFKTIANQCRPIRLGRGLTPFEFELPFTMSQPTLAVGAHLKNTIALAWDDRVVMSPHIGDLATPRSLDVFQQTVDDLQKLYSVKAKKIICDSHPDYASSRWAREIGLPIKTVLHHHAHASALTGEFYGKKRWLIFAWDGVGIGENQELWGGETLYGETGNWQRVGHLRPFPLIGGDKVVREIWRSALGLGFALGLDDEHLFKMVNLFASKTELAFLRQAWEKNINCLQTTAIGRLFDAVVALIGLMEAASFEGQAGMWLEALCEDDEEFIALPVKHNKQGLWEMDWSPLLNYLLDEHISIARKATCFHNSLAHGLLSQIHRVSAERRIEQVGLCGGVFQNRYLTEKVMSLLEQQGIEVCFPQKLPCNDASISFGQIMEA
ncbi:carbamoyltransferase HypF [Candidatus Albibeggiatoa sp. nov. NOAA]|uniref:carbamoyltransferase HypF n=1 Tax=Candidatus Albibeggiatoa sp. nov. NOAA TaxID=3162724 RepID=UPI0032FCB3C7|nr:carbamoyltransferase HypF [Thiotrichaceae bacterium]